MKFITILLLSQNSAWVCGGPPFFSVRKKFCKKNNKKEILLYKKIIKDKSFLLYIDLHIDLYIF